MSLLDFGNFEVLLKRSLRRKTVSLQIKAGKVSLYAPNNIPIAQLAKFAESKRAWIEAKLQVQHTPAKLHPLSILQHKPEMLFFGHWYPVEFALNKRWLLLFDEQSAFTFACPVVPEKVHIKKVASVFAKFYAVQAKHYLVERVRYLANECGWKPNQVVFKRYKARWGSCNSLGVVSLNTLLMLAPSRVIDYVIVHELCHLKFMNHSPSFWQLVRQHCDEVDSAKEWLKRHSYLLDWPS